MGYTAAAFGAIVIGHVFLRERRWELEWDWALWQYYFVVVLLCPVVAGASALAAAEHANVDALVRLSPRRVTVLEHLLRPVTLSAVGSFVGGFVLVLGFMRVRGVPGAPSAMFVAGAVPALLQVLVAGIFGCVVGLAIRRWIAAPVAGVAVFGGIILLYQLGAESVVIVGGASGSVFGLQPDVRRLAWQVILYVVLICMLAWASVSLLVRPIGLVARYAPAALVVVGGAIAWLMPNYPVFRDLPAHTECVVDSSTASVLCAAPGYSDLLPEAADRLAPFSAAVRELTGTDEEVVYVQRGGFPPPQYDGVFQGALTVEFLRGGDEGAWVALTPWLPVCGGIDDTDRLIAESVVYAWVHSQGVSGTDPPMSVLGPGTVTIDVARDAFGIVVDCD